MWLKQKCLLCLLIIGIFLLPICIQVERIQIDGEYIENYNPIISATEEWFSTWGNGNAHGVAIDSLGNIFLVGSSTVVGPAGRNIGLVKFDKNGNVQWYQTWGGNQNDFGMGVAIDSNDNIYVTGWTESSEFVIGNSATVTIKYDNDGNQIWYKIWGGSGRDESRGITIDSNDDIIIVGGTTSFTTPGFLIKYDSNGYEKWSKTGVKCNGFAGSHTRSNGIVVDSLDNIYIASGDQYILKYSSSGLKIWEKSWGGSSVYYYDIDLDSSNNIYVSGYDEDGPAGMYDIILVKFNNQGDYQWHRTWGGGQEDCNWGGIKIDDSNFIYLTGRTYSYGAGGADVVIIKYDNNGDQIWSKTWGDEWHNVGYDIFVDSSFNIFIVGESSGFLLIKYYQTKPKSFVLDSTAGNPDKDGSFELNWEQSNAVNYSIYQHDQPITDINQSILLQEGITGLSFPISNLIDGTYYYIIVAFNKYGNVSSNSLFVNIDRIPDPPYNPNPPDGSNEIGLDITLSVDVSHPSGVLMNVSFYNAYNDNLIGVDTGVFSGETASVSWLGLSEGTTYQWYVIVSDDMDITISSTWTFTTLDIPSWIQIPSNQIIKYGDSFNYDINAIDNSGIDYYWINNTIYFNIDENGVIINITILNVGTYWLEVRAYDPLGQYCTATFRVIVQDTIAPTWDIVPTDQYLKYGESLYYDLDATDLSGVEWDLNDTSYFNINTDGLITNITKLEVGDYYLEVRAYDPSGNYVSAFITIIVQEPEPESESKIIGIDLIPLIAIISLATIIPLIIISRRRKK